MVFVVFVVFVVVVVVCMAVVRANAKQFSLHLGNTNVQNTRSKFKMPRSWRD